MKAVFLVALLALAGCASQPQSRPETVTVIQKVAVPVAVTCVPPSVGVRPEYSDTDAALLAAADAAVRFQLLVEGRSQRNARLNELEPVVESCQKVK